VAGAPVRVGQIARLALAALILNLILIQPNHPAAMTWGALALFPLELPVILFGLVALGQRGVTTVLRVVLIAALVLIALLKAADFGMFTAFGRGFNLVADLPLFEAGVRLMSGSVGVPLTVGAILAALFVICVVIAALWWATGVWVRVRVAAPWRAASGLAAVLAGVVAVGEMGHAMGTWKLPFNPAGAAFTARVGAERVVQARDTLTELRTFAIAAQTDPYADAAPLLDAINRDVLVVFVESYGRASLDTPLYADLHRATLETGTARLAGLGLALRSGFVASPTKGGQSWLAHATFANGLWINDQTRYHAALVSGRQTLFHVAARSGFRTAAVMPQITLAWPEAEFMGFDTVLAAADLGYEGLPFNWVTMPDQFTLSALDRMLRSGQGEKPLFAQIALASSHAPWVPVPDLVAWDDVGDGTVFNDMAMAGDPPDVVWRDRDRVRAQYRLAIDYSLRTVIDYAARHAANPPLIIVVGDHQAAGFVALDDRPDVPVHVIGPAALVDRVADWGWGPGLIPAPESPVVPMDRLRDRLLDAFSSGAPRDGAG